MSIIEQCGSRPRSTINESKEKKKIPVNTPLSDFTRHCGGDGGIAPNRQYTRRPRRYEGMMMMGIVAMMPIKRNKFHSSGQPTTESIVYIQINRFDCDLHPFNSPRFQYYILISGHLERTVSRKEVPIIPIICVLPVLLLIRIKGTKLIFVY